MNGKRIFLIEDEPDMAQIVRDLLEPEGYRVFTANHPDKALHKVQITPPDLILLDIRLPDKDGYQVIRELKDNPKTRSIPVIMVSIKSDESDVVIGLELGAEDYLSKPYRKKELVARIKAVLRRIDDTTPVEKIQVGPFSVDYGRYEAKLRNRSINLTPKEFELFGYFLKKEGRVVTRPAISESVWGVEFTGTTRTIDVHVDQLRRKLGKYGCCITGLKGVGYRFSVEK